MALNNTNQYNVLTGKEWWVVRGSNPRPTRCKRVALPAELTTLFILKRKDLCHGGKILRRLFYRAGV